MNTRRLKIVRKNGNIGEAQLIAAITAGTDLPPDQATALARAVAEPPAYIEWAWDSNFPADQVADVLIKQGFEVAFDA
jgi:hypothetical protein